MVKTFLISDTHYGHHNMYKFHNSDGSKVRPWGRVKEADEEMIERWNSVVNDNDLVYHLGDVAIPRRGLQVLPQLNGRKKLIRGNHDIFKLKDYSQYFEEIYGTHKLGNYILSHIPLHPKSIPDWCLANIHGHLHNNLVMKKERSLWFPWRKTEAVDCRYINVSVERINYTPLDFNDIESFRTID